MYLKSWLTFINGTDEIEKRIKRPNKAKKIQHSLIENKQESAKQ